MDERYEDSLLHLFDCLVFDEVRTHPPVLLGRIEDGSYGKCEECGGDIGIERLKARPVTTLCIDCKSLQEAQERKLRIS